MVYALVAEHARRSAARGPAAPSRWCLRPQALRRSTPSPSLRGPVPLFFSETPTRPNPRSAAGRCGLVLTLGGGYPRDLDEASEAYRAIVSAHAAVYSGAISALL